MRLFRTAKRAGRTLLPVLLLVFSTYQSRASAEVLQKGQDTTVILAGQTGRYTGLVAMFTCSDGPRYYAVSSCFASLNGFAGGTLKITSGQQSGSFSQLDGAASLGYDAVSFHLLEHFRITAKMPSIESGFVLHLEVRSDTGVLLYKDDTGYFDTLSVSN